MSNYFGSFWSNFDDNWATLILASGHTAEHPTENKSSFLSFSKYNLREADF